MMKTSRRYRHPIVWAWASALSVLLVPTASGVAAEPNEHPLLDVLAGEMALSMDKLAGPDGAKPYFLQYWVTDQQRVNVSATLGSMVGERESHTRMLDVDLRCGDYGLDNTHQIRGAGFFGSYNRFGGWTYLPLDGDPLATRQVIWLKTDGEFKSSLKRLAQVQANVKVKVEEDDPSDDFSREEPSVHIGPWVEQPYELAQLKARVKRYSQRFRAHPLIYSSSVSVTGSITNRLAVNSEGSRLQFGQGWWRIGIQASTIAEDGMELWQYVSFDSHTLEGLPHDAEVIAGVDGVIADVLALRAAPLVDPYIGPAILLNRASGVFFHEIFGHRIEGHRQKDVEEGQTFAKKIDQEVLPTFLSLVDDPSQRTFKDIELNGYYAFDEECVASRPVSLVEDGVLKTFLLSRSPTRGFTKSNGHGRRQPGMRVVARQGNLMIRSTKQFPFDELRAMLVDECKKQGKDYGLLFEDISGGFTMTRRGGPQAFKVLPIIVYRVFADGRPDELVRGVDIVGTPLTCFSKILATADDAGVFNGVCGAESGSVPVSAVSPSILVEQIEIEKKRKAQDRPPILEAPIAAESG